MIMPPTGGMPYPANEPDVLVLTFPFTTRSVASSDCTATVPPDTSSPPLSVVFPSTVNSPLAAAASDAWMAYGTARSAWRGDISPEELFTVRPM